MIRYKKFQELFIRFMENTLDIPKGSYVSIDGETLRERGNKETMFEGVKELFDLGAGFSLSHILKVK